MTDYNSIKADEYAQRQGEMDEFDDLVSSELEVVFSELPSWASTCHSVRLIDLAMMEAKRRVMQAIKERGEP